MNTSLTKKHYPAVFIMVCFYIFLYIERPWESIRYLQGLYIERIYAVALIIIAILQNKFKIIISPTNKWVYGLLTLHFVLAPFTFIPGYSVEQGIEYAKLVILYVLMLSVAEDEQSLKLLVKTYVFSTMLYVFHSLWEYSNGRHVYRMGIARMVGVDSMFDDPNAFGATIILSLPFVFALLQSEENRHVRRIYYLYFTVALTCIVLTGSRTAFVAFLVLCAIWVLIQKGKRKLLILLSVLVSMVVVWNVMPVEKQERFRTLWDDQAGPENAKASADGRITGWKTSWSMFKKHPITGIGAGGKNFIAYRVSNYPEDGEQAFNQAHNLYGEVIAELGLFGAGLFLGLVVSIWRCCRWVRLYLKNSYEDKLFIQQLAGATQIALMLLLVLGIGGHNFYRPLWLWLAAWSGSLYMFTKRIVDARY